LVFDERGIPKEVLHHRGEGWRFQRLEPYSAPSLSGASRSKYKIRSNHLWFSPVAIGLYDSESLCGGTSQFPAIRL
jgi:hypothetical protein